MSFDRIEKTVLWQRSLGVQKMDSNSEKRDELRVSFLNFRKKVSQIVSQIYPLLPGLTLHDISHLDALWETASAIAGEDYPLNAMEGFVLGGAILLHDSALCVEAYRGGLDGIRNTLTWKDSYVDVLEKNPGVQEDVSKSQADFLTLRYLHAEQCKTLLETTWTDPETKEHIYLLENDTLRKHLGQIIGQIAASHHWDIEKVANTFGSSINALAGYPREWRIDPIKIACILRCADSAHIDSERAPDFLHALIRRQGLSFQHWQAQNMLGGIDVVQSKQQIPFIQFTSIRSFTVQESKAWWIAYDAVQLVDKEIRSANALLESLVDPIPFSVKGVIGVETVQQMTKYLKVDGWQPCMAKIHVGDVEKLVRNLGGEALYGSVVDQDMFQVVVRELVQNARDGVKAREIFDNVSKGKILIKIMEEGDNLWLAVSDNGIGMSERVLTGPLLDFGTSFWASSLIQEQFPGLRSSSFRPVGKFGIGFFSVFMIAEEVRVTSRPWRKGISDAMQIQFEDGLSLRPMLKQGPDVDFNSLTSTQIRLRLKKGTLNNPLKIEIKRNLMGTQNFFASIQDYLSSICVGLDVSVFFSSNASEEIQIHQSLLDLDFNAKNWLENVSFSKFQDRSVSLNIDRNVSRLRQINENGRLLGYAAISTILEETQDFLGTSTIGGLAASVHNRSGNHFIGFIDQQPRSAKRDQSGVYSASEDIMTNWATDQLKVLELLDLTSMERYAAACNLVRFKVDPVSIATVLIRQNEQQFFLTIPKLATLTEKEGIFFLINIYGQVVFNFEHDLPKELPVIVPLNRCSFMTIKLEDNYPVDQYSLLGMIYNLILKNGRKPFIEVTETDKLDRYNNSKIRIVFLKTLT